MGAGMAGLFPVSVTDRVHRGMRPDPAGGACCEPRYSRLSFIRVLWVRLIEASTLASLTSLAS